MGLQSGEAPELWNIDHPDRVIALHREFIRAGADIVLTNSFGGSSYRLKLHRAEDRVTELNRAAAALARQAAAEVDHPVVVAGSIGPTGEILEPVGTLEIADAQAAFEAQAVALADGGAQVLWLETLSSKEEMRAAAAAASRTGLPVVATMTFDTNGSTMMGVSPAELVALYRELVPGLVAFGANCGIPRFVDGEINYSGTPELMADYARLSRDTGARIIGGCCGTTPRHLRAMHQALVDYVPAQMPDVEQVIGRLGDMTAGTRACFEGLPRPGVNDMQRVRGRRRRRTR